MSQLTFIQCSRSAWRRSSIALLLAVGLLPAIGRAQEKLPPERTYSKAPYVHNIPLLDKEGNVIRSPKPDDPADVKAGVFSMQMTCGKCHSDYATMVTGWHFNFSDEGAPHGRPGEPWILTDRQTRTELPLSYRRWKGTFHPHEIGLNDFNFALLFARHHPGGGALAESDDLRFKMSGNLEVDCLICHTADDQYDPVVRAQAIREDQNFEQAAILAAYLGEVQGTAARLKDDFDPSGRDARRAPKAEYFANRFDSKDRVHFNVTNDISNDRCYTCHSALDVGDPQAANLRLESRWTHAGDVHLVQGMSCVDCHRNGADHMIVRGYEGEFAVRVEALGEEHVSEVITTLTCAGCHYGTEQTPGNIGAAPTPVHRGLPTLHFDVLSCTACHAGPSPTASATAVQTAMAHKLGLPRHHTADGAAPWIQQPVFLPVDELGKPLPSGPEHEAGKLTPHRMIYPSFWGRMNGETITPTLPKYVLAAGAGDVLGAAPDAREAMPMEPVTPEQIAQVLGKLASASPPEIEPADVVTALNSPASAPATQTASATTQAATPVDPPTTPSTTPAWATGEPVYVTGGKVYRLKKDGEGVESFAHAVANPYAWAIGHDVRPAAQALGAQSCVECHSDGAPIAESTVSTASLIADASQTQPMYEISGQPMGAWRVFAWTYGLRPLLIAIGFVCAGVIAVVLLGGMVRAAASAGRP